MKMLLVFCCGQEIQCYICKSFGHVCCVDSLHRIPMPDSCYNCGQSGHLGSVSYLFFCVMSYLLDKIQKLNKSCHETYEGMHEDA